MSSKCPKCAEIGDIESFEHEARNEYVVWYMACVACDVQWDVYFDEGVVENVQRIGE